MKKTFFIFIIIILFSNLTYSQLFSLYELTNLLNKNIDEFDSFLLSKEFRFSSAKADSEIDEILYVYNQKEDGFAVKYVTKYVFKENNEQSIVYQTPNSEEYISFKNQLKSQKYKFINSENGINNDALLLFYENNNYKIILASGHSLNKKGEKIRIYEITIIKKQKSE